MLYAVVATVVAHCPCSHPYNSKLSFLKCLLIMQMEQICVWYVRHTPLYVCEYICDVQTHNTARPQTARTHARTQHTRCNKHARNEASTQHTQHNTHHTIQAKPHIHTQYADIRTYNSNSPKARTLCTLTNLHNAHTHGHTTHTHTHTHHPKVSGKGTGKTVLVKAFAQILGYTTPLTVQVYEVCTDVVLVLGCCCVCSCACVC